MKEGINFTKDLKSDRVLNIKLEHDTLSDRHKFLLTSDIHIDSKKCDRSLLKKHFQEAKEQNAGIFIFGDLFDAMQGKYDPRAAKGALKPEYMNPLTYHDAITDDAAKFLAPYAKHICGISEGNHETSIKRRAEIDLLRLTQLKIYRLTNIEVPLLSYWGFIKFICAYKTHRPSKVMYFHHGHGGSSPVTKGVIQAQRRAAQVDADICVSGHIHNSWYTEHNRVRLAGTKIESYTQEHISLGCYKESTFGAWEGEKGFSPPSMGGTWLELELTFDKDYHKTRLINHVTRAK